MSIHTLTKETFSRFIQENELVFIDFWAAWCSPCKPFSKHYEQVAAQFFDIQFASVNIEEQKELAQICEIRSIPHLLIFKQGVVIYSDVGNKSEAVLIELAEQALDCEFVNTKK
jgi:thioredoxin 1